MTLAYLMTVGYELYPIADGASQVAQVDQAIRWAESGAPLEAPTSSGADEGMDEGMDHRARDGPSAQAPAQPSPAQSSPVSPQLPVRLLSDGAKIVVVGHSAGGHLAATALLGRAASGSGQVKLAATVGALALLSAPLELRRHVVHEATRGVAVISALSAAFVGDDGRTFIDGDEVCMHLEDGERSGEETLAGQPRCPRLFDDSQPLATLSPEHMVSHHTGHAIIHMHAHVARAWACM